MSCDQTMLACPTQGAELATQNTGALSDRKYEVRTFQTVDSDSNLSGATAKEVMQKKNVREPL